MSLRLGCIADDYTGASDLANTLTRNGLRTVQTIGVPAAGLPLADVDAVVVSLKSRSIAAADAVASSRAAARWLRGQGAAHVMFKICSTFDSTDAGNIGPVTLALQADGGVESLLVTPAFPETGRTVYQGHLFVNGVPLNESPLKDHPLNPMRDSNLVRVLQRQCGDAQIGLIDAEVVARGPAAILTRQRELAQQHRGIAIIDAIRESDLLAIGAAAIGQKLSVGASGLGLGLARALAVNSVAKPSDAGAPVGGLAACLVGSCSKATLEQIDAAAQFLPVLRLRTENIMDNSAEIEDALEWAAARLATAPVLIASSGSTEEVASLQERYGRERAGHAIEQAMAAIAAGLVARGVRRLVVGGGETSGAVINRLGISAFQLGPEIAPGVPVLRSLGGKDAGMLLALKSGNFGGQDFFMRALAMMH
ncbi:HPr kinase [Acidocella aquatica]|uniref:3-oxo-tetronate kinase n=1 Tax=Acidocella aquatica TaxID=1922313 RepID=A0ABQ6A2Z5_9PROT|nr:3-oxo-tetronate kinase [Acidocella aquatica]GLR66850.1 HPr kinase [Acidocella aquatica]